jgi:hypothetical protein
MAPISRKPPPKGILTPPAEVGQRTRRVKTLRSGETQEVVGDLVTAHEVLDATLQGRRRRRYNQPALYPLPHDRRTLLHQRESIGLTYPDIAEAMATSHRTVAAMLAVNGTTSTRDGLRLVIETFVGHPDPKPLALNYLNRLYVSEPEQYWLIMAELAFFGQHHPLTLDQYSPPPELSMSLDSLSVDPRTFSHWLGYDKTRDARTIFTGTHLIADWARLAAAKSLSDADLLRHLKILLASDAFTSERDPARYRHKNSAGWLHFIDLLKTPLAQTRGPSHTRHAPLLSGPPREPGDLRPNLQRIDASYSEYSRRIGIDRTTFNYWHRVGSQPSGIIHTLRPTTRIEEVVMLDELLFGQRGERTTARLIRDYELLHILQRLDPAPDPKPFHDREVLAPFDVCCERHGERFVRRLIDMPEPTMKDMMRLDRTSHPEPLHLALTRAENRKALEPSLRALYPRGYRNREDLGPDHFAELRRLKYDPVRNTHWARRLDQYDTLPSKEVMAGGVLPHLPREILGPYAEVIETHIDQWGDVFLDEAAEITFLPTRLFDTGHPAILQLAIPWRDAASPEEALYYTADYVDRAIADYLARQTT